MMKPVNFFKKNSGQSGASVDRELNRKRKKNCEHIRRRTRTRTRTRQITENEKRNQEQEQKQKQDQDQDQGIFTLNTPLQITCLCRAVWYVVGFLLFRQSCSLPILVPQMLENTEYTPSMDCTGTGTGTGTGTSMSAADMHVDNLLHDPNLFAFAHPNISTSSVYPNEPNWLKAIGFHILTHTSTVCHRTLISLRTAEFPIANGNDSSESYTR